MQQFLKGVEPAANVGNWTWFLVRSFSMIVLFPLSVYLGHGMADGDGLFLKVNSVPFQTHDFAPTQPVESRQYDAQFNRIAAHDLE